MSQRRRVLVTGRVQSVGFRPWVVRTARALSLVGWVGNDRTGVVLEAQGCVERLDDLEAALGRPDLVHAEVRAVTSRTIATGDDVDFTIRPGGEPLDRSSGAVGADPLPDLAPCAACRAEFHDSAARRCGYVFTSCTSCGPRASVTLGAPWDRQRTTMAPFGLCGPCQREHDDVGDRRFGAETLCCERCGPTLSSVGADGRRVRGDLAVVDRLVALLAEGGVAAVKGIGGFHLVGRADLDDVVSSIRTIKARERRPLAVLVADAGAAERLVELDEVSLGALVDTSRPVVLARRRDGAAVSSLVAAGSPDLGVMLPSSLLHEALAVRVGTPLVLTSANPTGAPTIVEDESARALDGVDVVAGHDRRIARRLDDRVVRSMAGTVVPLRTGRGDAPIVLRPGVVSDRRVLAVGGHLKNTVAAAHGDRIVVSGHIGDLHHPDTHAAWSAAVDHVLDVIGGPPDLVVTDLHPDYASTLWGHDLEGDVMAVQHHHAHVASTLADRGMTEGPVVGLALDGHGVGTDGSSWGGEVLVVDGIQCRRFAHLRPVALPGGEAAIREGWRMAVAWLRHLDVARAVEAGARWDPRADSVERLCGADEDAGRTTTSVGRLLDALGALCGVGGVATFDGETALGLETLAGSGGDPADRGRVRLDGGVLDPIEMLEHVVADLDAGVEPAIVAAGAIDDLADGVARAGVEAAGSCGASSVVLTGGCFQNRRLTQRVQDRVDAAGLEVVLHRSVPPNDGGLSAGQALLGMLS